MKKTIALAVLAVTAVSLLASCSSGTKENLNSRPYSTESQDKKATNHLNVDPDD